MWQLEKQHSVGRDATRSQTSHSDCADLPYTPASLCALVSVSTTCVSCRQHTACVARGTAAGVVCNVYDVICAPLARQSGA